MPIPPIIVLPFEEVGMVVLGTRTVAARTRAIAAEIGINVAKTREIATEAGIVIARTSQNG